MGEPAEITSAHGDAPHSYSSPTTSLLTSASHHPHQKGIRMKKENISIFRLLAMHLIDILIPNFLMSVTSSLELPLIALLGRQYGFHTSFMAQVIALVAFCRALLDVPWGVLIELFGLRFMIVASLLLNILAAMVGFYFHTSISLILFAVLSSSTVGGFFLTMDVFTARVVPKNHRGTVMSTISGVVRWAHVLGPTLIGIIISITGDVRYAFWLAVATSSLACLNLLYSFRPRHLSSVRSNMGTEDEKYFHRKRKLKRRKAEASAAPNGRSKESGRKNAARNANDHEKDVREKTSGSEPGSVSSRYHSSGSPHQKETVLSVSGVVPLLISTSAARSEKEAHKSKQTTSGADHDTESGVALSPENKRKEESPQEPSPVVLPSLEGKRKTSSVPSVTTTAPFSSSDMEKKAPHRFSSSPPQREAAPLLPLWQPTSSSLPSNASSPLPPISPAPSSNSDRRHSSVSISHLTNTQPPSSSSLPSISVHASSVSSPPRLSSQKVRSLPKEVKVISPSYHYGATDEDNAQQQGEGKPPKGYSPLLHSSPAPSSAASPFQCSILPHSSRFRHGHDHHGRWHHSAAGGTHRHLLQKFLFYYHFSRPPSYPDGIHYRSAHPSFASHRHHRSHSPFQSRMGSSRFWNSKKRGLHGRMRRNGGMPTDRELGSLNPMVSSAMPTEVPCHPSGFFQMLNQYKSTIFFLGCYVILLTGLRSNRKLMLAFAVMDSNWSDENLAFLLSFGFCVDAVLFPLGGIVMDRFGRQWAMVPVTVGFAFSFALLKWATTVPLLFAASALFGLVDSFGCGLVKTLVADRAPRHWGSPFFGIMRMLEDVGHVVGAAGVGRVLHAVGFSRTCFVLAFTGVFTALWGILLIPPVVAEEELHGRQGEHDGGSVHRSSDSDSDSSRRSSFHFSSGDSSASFASRRDSAASISSACSSCFEYSSVRVASQEKSKKEEAADAHLLV